MQTYYRPTDTLMQFRVSLTRIYTYPITSSKTSLLYNRVHFSIKDVSNFTYRGLKLNDLHQTILFFNLHS